MEDEDCEASVLRAFQSCDSNGDGVMSRDEFHALLKCLSAAYGEATCFPDSDVDAIFTAADTNKNDAIEFTELVKFLFADGATCPVTSTVAPVPAAPEDDSNSVSDESSSSSSSEDDATMARRPSASTNRKRLQKKKRHVARSLKHEEPLTTVDEMYELLTMDKGRITGLLRLQELVNCFAMSKKAKLGPMLARLMPQECARDGEAEDVSPLEIVHLLTMLMENPQATEQDAIEVITSIKDVCRTTADVNVEALGLDQEAAVGFGKFRRIIGFLEAAMKIDQSQILAVMAYAYTERFELTECMAIAVMQNVFLSVARPGEHILELSVTNNDFLRMCYAAGFVDNTGRKGLGSAHLEILFVNTVKHLPSRRLDREKRRKEPLGKKPRKRRHKHKGIRGRTELAIIMEELYKALPGRMYTSALHLVLDLMDRGKSGQRERLK